MKILHSLIKTGLLTIALLFSVLAHAEYLLGPGDMVRIFVYGNQDLNVETRITQSGTLTFPLIGEVDVSGLSVVQSEKKVASMLSQGGFVKNPQVNMVVTQFSSRQVSILGDVYKPGRYSLERNSNLIEILALAGGVSQSGSDTVMILSRREGKTEKQNYDLPDLLRKGEGLDIMVNPDDVIYISHAPMFYVYGEVQRPGTFRLERNMTVAQALAVGGGLTVRGTERRLHIKRRNEAGTLEHIEAKLDDMLLKDDVLYVRESLF